MQSRGGGYLQRGRRGLLLGSSSALPSVITAWPTEVSPLGVVGVGGKGTVAAAAAGSPFLVFTTGVAVQCKHFSTTRSLRVGDNGAQDDTIEVGAGGDNENWDSGWANEDAPAEPELPVLAPVIEKPIEEPVKTWERPHHAVWWCLQKECSAVNLHHFKGCHRCGGKRPKDVQWFCSECSTRNLESAPYCGQCACPRRKAKDYWDCPGCLQQNSILKESTEVQGGGGQLQGKLREECHSCAYSLLEDRSKAWDGKAVEQVSDDPWQALVLSIVQEEVPNMPGPPGFDWMCRDPACGTANAGNNEFCEKCAKKLVPSMWICQTCASTNQFSRSQCFHCRTPISLFWFCRSCPTKTSIYEVKCRACKTFMPPVAAVTAPPQVPNQLQGLQPQQQSKKLNSWLCSMCHKQNYGGKEECFGCGAPHTQAIEMPESDAVLPDTNWKCHGCNAKNFRTRTSCWKCSMPCLQKALDGGIAEEEFLPQIEKEGFQDDAEGQQAPTRQYSARPEGNWLCAKCFERNHKSKKDCWKCGASKQLLAKARLRVRAPTKI